MSTYDNSLNQYHMVKMELDERSSSPLSHETDSGKKRNRCSNFSSHEKNLLIHILEKYQETVECKKSDKASLQEKERVWQLVTQEFNELSMSKPERTNRQLKMCYENLKRRIRKETSSLSSVGIEESNTVNRLNGLEAGLNDLGSSTTLPAPVSDGDSICSTQFLEPSCQGSSGSGTEQYKPERRRRFTHHASRGTAEVRRRHSTLAFKKLRRVLLSKEIKLVELDLEMRAKKYNLELQVEQAKLQYYQKKISMLENNIR